MKKILLTKNQEHFLFEHIINESACYEGDKEELVKQFLKGHFVPADREKEDNFGVYTKDSKEQLVCKLDSNHQPSDKIITKDDLFDILQYKFQTLFDDKEYRDNFLKRVRDDWYNGK